MASNQKPPNLNKIIIDNDKIINSDGTFLTYQIIFNYTKKLN